MKPKRNRIKLQSETIISILIFVEVIILVLFIAYQMNVLYLKIKKVDDSINFSISSISLMVAIVSVVVTVDSASKWKDFLRNYPKLLLKSVILDSDNPNNDLSVFENMGSMDISDFKELKHMTLKENQYSKFAKTKYIPSGQSVSFYNTFSRESKFLFRYIQTASLVENRFVVISDGFYKLELQTDNTYFVIQKSVTFYCGNKKEYEKGCAIKTVTNNELLSGPNTPLGCDSISKE